MTQKSRADRRDLGDQLEREKCPIMLKATSKTQQGEPEHNKQNGIKELRKQVKIPPPDKYSQREKAPKQTELLETKQMLREGSLRGSF